MPRRPSKFDFEQVCTDMLMRMGAKPNDNEFGYEFILDTKVGLLYCSPRNRSLFCMFDDVKAGKQLTNTSNPYTGKWNFHPSVPDQAAVDLIEKSLLRVVAEPVEYRGARYRTAAPIDLDEFLAAYMEAAVWTSTDENGEPLDANRGVEDLAPQTVDSMREDCRRFLEENAEALAAAQYRHREDHDAELAGQDFWLTRNHHGAGFWDGDLPESVARALTDAAHQFGEVDLYVGDDGLVYAA